MRKHGNRKRNPHEPKASPSQAPNSPEHSDDLNDDDPHWTPVKLPQQKQPRRPIVLSDDEDDAAQEADPIASSIPHIDLLQPALGMKTLLQKKTPLPSPAARPASPPAILPLATVAPSVPSSSRSQPQPPLTPEYHHDSYIQKIPSGPSQCYLPDQVPFNVPPSYYPHMTGGLGRSQVDYHQCILTFILQCTMVVPRWATHHK
jgi:hypothetical protein